MRKIGDLPRELMGGSGQVLGILCLGMLLKVFNMVGIVGVLLEKLSKVLLVQCSAAPHSPAPLAQESGAGLRGGRENAGSYQ